jgi:amino acid transporter
LIFYAYGSAEIVLGTLTGAELLQSLAQDRILPAFFSRSLPWSGAHHLAIIAFGAFSAVVYALSGFSLDIVSKM